jgi:hypothetical protein
MIKRASAKAEEMFNTSGQVEHGFLVDSAIHGLVTVGAPITGPNGGDEDKAAIELMMPETFHRMKVSRYVQIMEAWYVEPDDEIDGVPLRDNPRRKEKVVLCYNDGTHEIIISRAIIRPTNGKAYLGPLPPKSQWEMTPCRDTKQRFDNLLERRVSGALFDALGFTDDDIVGHRRH